MIVDEEVPAAQVREAVLAGGGELLRVGRRSSTSTAASRSARGARAWRCGSASAPPIAPSPTRRSPGCASRSAPGWPSLEGRSVSDAAPRRRSRRPRRRRRRLRLRRRAGRAAGLGPPAARAGRGHQPQRRRQAARRALPALPGAAGADGARPRADGGGRRGDRRLPARRLGAGGGADARPRPAGGRPLGRLPAARPASSTRSGTGRTASRQLLADAVYGLPELHREADPRAPSWSRTRAAIRPRRCWRWRRSPSRA